MSNKLVKKLAPLIGEAKVGWWNGHQIKKCSFGDYDSKVFQVDGKKYKLGIEVSTKCNNETKFVPQPYDLRLTDYRQGRNYCDIKSIADFLGIEENVVEDLIKPMQDKTTYSKEEIEESIQGYKSFVVNFHTNFLGNEVDEDYIMSLPIEKLI